jgi:Yip1 domain
MMRFLQFLNLSGVSGKKLMRARLNPAETRTEFFMAEPESIGSGEAANPPGMSLGNRLVNVFVSPSEVFDEVKASPPNAANWWVPLTLGIIISVIYVMVVFSQPAVVQSMKDAQEKKMQQQVDAGKMTRQQADQALEMIDKWMGPSMIKVFGIIGVCVTQPVMLFFVAFVMWLLGRWVMPARFDYMKAVEMVGLATMIAVVGGIVSMLVAVIYGNPSMTPGPVLLVSHYDPSNRVHAVLSALNLVTLWYVAVVAIGLSRLSGSSFLKAAAWTFAVWAILALVPVLIFGGH